jgi:ankyrin repeat protein
MELAWDNYHWGGGRYSTQEWFCLEVAEMNKLEYLVWAREVKNCDWDSRTINWAAKQGNLAMVKYCVENGCPMDEVACTWAAEEGHLDVLKYLHENDCPWNSLACYFAHRYNHVDCLNYLIEQKCPGWRRYT